MSESFRKMCQGHDLTYAYSDDGAVWRNGVEQERRIKEAAKSLDPLEAKRIWNEVVDTKIVEGSRAQFYWR